MIDTGIAGPVYLREGWRPFLANPRKIQNLNKLNQTDGFSFLSVHKHKYRNCQSWLNEITKKGFWNNASPAEEKQPIYRTLKDEEYVTLYWKGSITTEQ